MLFEKLLLLFTALRPDIPALRSPRIALAYCGVANIQLAAVDPLAPVVRYKRLGRAVGSTAAIVLADHLRRRVLANGLYNRPALEDLEPVYPFSITQEAFAHPTCSPEEYDGPDETLLPAAGVCPSHPPILFLSIPATIDLPVVREIYIQPKCNVDSYDGLDDNLLPNAGTCDAYLPILRPTMGLSAPPETCAHSTCNIDATDEDLLPMRTRQSTNWFGTNWAVLRSSARVLFGRFRGFFKTMFKSSNLRAAWTQYNAIMKGLAGISGAVGWIRRLYRMLKVSFKSGHTSPTFINEYDKPQLRSSKTLSKTEDNSDSTKTGDTVNLQFFVVSLLPYMLFFFIAHNILNQVDKSLRKVKQEYHYTYKCKRDDTPKAPSKQKVGSLRRSW